MKRKFKLFSTLTALICSIVTIGLCSSITTNALDYGDINGDGIINLSDRIALNKFLFGQGVLQDYTIADLNVNGAIDVVDGQILLAYIIETIDSLPYTS